MSNCNHEQQIAQLAERVSILEHKVNENYNQNNDQDFEKPKKKKVPSSKNPSFYSLNKTNDYDVLASPGKRSSSVELKPTEGPSHFIGSRYPITSKKRTSKEAPTVLYENRNFDVSGSHQITNDEINNLMRHPPTSWNPAFFNIMLSTYQNTQYLSERLAKIEDFLGIQGQGISDEPLKKPKKSKLATQKNESNNIQQNSLSQQLTQITQTLAKLSDKQEEFSKKQEEFSKKQEGFTKKQEGFTKKQEGFTNDLSKLSRRKEKKGNKIDKLINNIMKDIKAYKEEEEKEEEEKEEEEKEEEEKEEEEKEKKKIR